MSDYETVLEIAKQHLHKVKRSGPDNIMASCPFHTSDDPGGSTTFSMSLSKGVYFCFSCHASGNLRAFLKNLGVAPYIIEQQKGLIDRLSTATPKKSLRKFNPKAVDTIPESLLGIFDWCPTLLREKGFEERTLRQFDVGFDHYHDMVTFPLRDVDGQLVGISGRKIAGDGPRYKIYTTEYKTWGMPARKMPERRALLWNIHRAAPQCTVTDSPLILVEGFKACMWTWQAGFTNVAALLGSALTQEQSWIIQQIGVPVILMLDGNAAGRDGTLRTGRKLQDHVPVHVALIPEEEQPDDLLPEQLSRVLGNKKVFQLWAAGQHKRGSIWKEGR